MKMYELLESTNSSMIDNKDGWGAVPDNQEVDYLGIRVTMTPKHFIDLAAPLDSEPSDKIAQHLEQGGTIGAPFLQIEIPESWEDGDFAMPARVMGHEGRNRMAAVAKVFGNNPVETHLFFNKGLRNRHITDEFKKNLNRGLVKEKSKSIIRGPFFSLSENIKEDGRIVKGINTTVDVGPNEIKIQAAKFGNTVDKDGRPPTMSKAVKGSSTNVLYNLTLAERYTPMEIACIEGGHCLEDLKELRPSVPKKPGRLFASLTEGYKLQLERDRNVLVLNIVDNATGKRTEVRGKPGYETNGYDANDPLHKLLDVVGKSANISELMNGEVVTINPKHPDAARALAATDRAYNEAFDTDVEWVEGPGAGGSTVFAAKVDDAYIEITYKPVSKGVYISFTRGARMSVTGEGSQNKIFGAVINHIKKWVDANKPQEIYFSAFKPRTGAFGSQDTTRSGLYRKMVQRFASQNGYDYDVEDGGNEDTFILKRKENNTQTTEALDQPYPVRWSVKNDEMWYGHAKEDDFYNQMGIEIKSISEGRWSIRFKVGDKMDKTGAGDEFRTFATVKAAIQQWWAWASKNAEVDVITFSAEKIVDSSRSRLYNRFAQQFARTIGYDMEVVTGRASDIFYLKKPGLEENFADGKEIGIHRSSEDFAVIDLSKSADGTFWLNGIDNTDWDSTVTTGQGVDMAFEISPQAKLASYDDIDKYSIGELENMGYDGVRMKDGDNVAYQIWNTKILKRTKLGENFADGKKPGRKGLAKRSGVNTKASVSSLRKTAKNSSGEKQRMAHWLANMKAGRAKKK